MRKWLLTTAVFLGLLALGGVALSQNGGGDDQASPVARSTAAA